MAKLLRLWRLWRLRQRMHGLVYAQEACGLDIVTRVALHGQVILARREYRALRHGGK